jgi:hypothetical protein
MYTLRDAYKSQQDKWNLILNDNIELKAVQISQ